MLSKSLSVCIAVLTLVGCGDDTSPPRGAGAAGGAGGTSATAGSAGNAAGATGGAGASSGGASAMGGAGGGASGSAGTSAGGAGGADGVTCQRPTDMPAVTLTYDDALPTQLKTVAPLLKQHNLVATFFVTDVRANPSPWAALLADGHELGSHTFIHPCPKVNTWVAPGNANEDYDLARMGTELDQSIALLGTMGQKPPFTFAYPCGVTWVGEAQESYIPLIEARFSAARGVVSGGVQAGVNLYEVPATFSMGTGDELIALAEQAKAQKTWVVYGFHGIGGDSNITPADSHEALIKYLDEQRASFHIATFRELAACFAP